MNTPPLILASSSPFRRQLMRNAGLVFDACPAEIDERAIEAPLAASGAAPDQVALALAQAKALDVAARRSGSTVIGSDQTMSLGEHVFHKPANRTEARNHLLSLSGRTHQLNSAVALARDGEILWRHISHARLTVRDLSEDFIESYLDRAGEKALQSVGAYQLEGEGIHLFSHIEGDYFTIIGLPLLPLLAELRKLGLIYG